jgi:hypothetical protein
MTTTTQNNATILHPPSLASPSTALPQFWNLLRLSFVSTLTHELFHVLGFEHISDPDEILCPKRGGIYARNPQSPDIATCVLKRSPKTRSACIWMYGPTVEERKRRLGGVPIHCCSCYQLGWMWMSERGDHGEDSGLKSTTTNMSSARNVNNRNKTLASNSIQQSGKPALNKHY